MGIRGLTTFVAQYSDKFLQRHQLHDTYLVLDGNNICCQLYIWHCKVFDCFGGDYDTFGRLIETFFDGLKRCNITPIIVFDGNYEWKKLKTIFARHRDRIETAGKLTPGTEGTCNVFPLFTRVMFPEVVRRLGLHIYRCELEADNELACLGRALNCPVLSYDSDFYIFDVLYVPFKSLDFVPRYNRLGKFWYLDCDLYKTENFLNSFPGLRREHLPLIATLLGNDYIKASVFKKFYSQLKLKRGNGSSVNLQQRRIRTVIQWLRTETFATAVRKILNRLKIHERKRIAKKIDIIVKGYVCCDSIVLRDLNISYRPDNSSTFDLRYNIDDLIESCDHLQVSDEESEECSEQDDEEITTMLGITNEEPDDKVDETISSIATIPTWFVKKHNLCEYPSVIYEIAHGLFFFFTPQVEDYNNKPSHSICFKIIAAINKILTQSICNSKERELTVVGRNDSNGVRKFKLPRFEQSVISLQEIPNLSEDKRLDFMLHVLDLDFCKSIFDHGRIPNDWHLLVLSMIFWSKNATVQIKPRHTISVFLCGLILKLVDKKIGPIRNLTRLRTKYATLLNTPKTTIQSPDFHCINDILTNTSDTESAFALLALMPYFHISDKIARNHKQFDIRIVDAFAQLQCSLFYINALNCLLNEPLEALIISDFYNGTFLYNVCANFNKRADVTSYLKLLLADAPSIVNACVRFEELLGSFVGGADGESAREENKKKRHRKSHNRKNTGTEEDVYEVVESDDDEKAFVDDNNVYSVLSSIQ